MRHRDRQRIGDHEAADEQRDSREREEEPLNETREAAHTLLVLLDLRRRVAHLRACREDSLQLADQLRRRDAVPGLDADQIDLANAVQQPLRGRGVKNGHRGAADRDAGELDNPGNPEVPHRTAALHADRVADLVVLAARHVRIDRDLVRSARPRPGRQHERVEALVRGRIDAEGELWCTA